MLVFGRELSSGLGEWRAQKGSYPQVPQEQVLALQKKHFCRGGALCPELPSFNLHRQHSNASCLKTPLFIMKC